jgi:hypothetical protein
MTYDEGGGGDDDDDDDSPVNFNVQEALTVYARMP